MISKTLHCMWSDLARYDTVVNVRPLSMYISIYLQYNPYKKLFYGEKDSVGTSTELNIKNQGSVI